MSDHPERLGVLGGTFDPPHVAHVVAAVTVRHALALDRVLLVVANRPWQKVGDREVSDPKVRLAMVEALARGVAGVEASAMEIDRGGDSYTVDTLDALALADPDGARFLVLGADAAAGLPTWERAERLPELATLVLVDRPGLASPPPPDGWPVQRVAMPRLDVSSTDLRRRVSAGEPIDGLVPPAVVSLIDEHRLYRGRS